MATPSITLDRLDPYAAARSDVDRVPWFLYAVLFASTSVIVGVIWDISWHRTIGRDTFWTPAHLAIYLGGIVAGLTCGWIALTTTFSAPPDATMPTVRFWGFRAPLGAWVCIWGAFAMLTSAPFDDWWHNAYGLDVKIISPPHMLLALGFAGIMWGAAILAVAIQSLPFPWTPNHAQPHPTRPASRHGSACHTKDQLSQNQPLETVRTLA